MSSFITGYFVLKQEKHRYTHCCNYNSPGGYRNAGQNQQNDSYEAELVRWIKKRTEDGAGRPIVNKTNDVDKRLTSVWLLLYGHTIVRLEIAALQRILLPCPDFRLYVLLWCELIFPDFENKFYLLHAKMNSSGKDSNASELNDNYDALAILQNTEQFSFGS